MPMSLSPTLKENQLPLPDATLVWTREGNANGPTIVWAHGLMSDSYSLEDKGIYDFAPICAAGTLIRYDARGHGRSLARPVPERFSWHCLADDLLALAKVAAPNGPMMGMGCSMGTATLLHAALKAPETFTKLVLTAPPTAWKTRRAHKLVYQQSARTIERDGQPALDALVANMAPPPLFTDLPAIPVETHRDVLPAILRGAAMSDLPSPDDLKSISVPVLILAWENDPSHPLQTAQALADLLPDARLHITTSADDVRHWGHRIANFMQQPA